MTRSYPEPLRVTGPLLSLVLRTEDVWQRYNHFHRSVRGSQSGFPLLTPIMETYDGPVQVNMHFICPHFRGLRDSLEYKHSGGVTL